MPHHDLKVSPSSKYQWSVFVWCGGINELHGSLLGRGYAKSAVFLRAKGLISTLSRNASRRAAAAASFRKKVPFELRR
jgi:hypothetical protein